MTTPELLEKLKESSKWETAPWTMAANLVAILQEMDEALDFYADPENYVGQTFSETHHIQFAHPECEAVAKYVRASVLKRLKGLVE